MLKWWCCRTGWSRDSRRRRKKVCNWVKVSSPTSQHIVKNLYRCSQIRNTCTGNCNFGSWQLAQFWKVIIFLFKFVTLNLTNILHTAYISECSQVCLTLDHAINKHTRLRLCMMGVHLIWNKQFYVNTYK